MAAQKENPQNQEMSKLPKPPATNPASTPESKGEGSDPSKKDDEIEKPQEPQTPPEEPKPKTKRTAKPKAKKEEEVEQNIRPNGHVTVGKDKQGEDVTREGDRNHVHFEITDYGTPQKFGETAPKYHKRKTSLPPEKFCEYFKNVWTLESIHNMNTSLLPPEELTDPFTLYRIVKNLTLQHVQRIFQAQLQKLNAAERVQRAEELLRNLTQLRMTGTNQVLLKDGWHWVPNYDAELANIFPAELLSEFLSVEVGTGQSAAEQLQGLIKMRDNGDITKEEFESLKKNIVSQ